MHSDEFRRCLVECDVAGIRAVWAHVAPHLPVGDDATVLATIHRARTEAKSIALNLRAYSHAWLEDRGLPSGLPDELKPAAERIYPRIAEGVGISVRASSEFMKPVAAAVQVAMSDAVSEAYADGKTDTSFVRARMNEARRSTFLKLIGR